MATTTNITESYRWARSRGLSAMASIRAARRDLADGRRGYLSSPTVSYGPRAAAYGESHCRFVENIADGLRFVGFADELAGLRHVGWHLDDDGCGETVRGAVWRLPARNGRPCFVAGYADPWNMLAAFISFDITDDATTAAIWADRIAELMAESEREYQRAWQDGREFEELAEYVADTRRAILALIREEKELCRNSALAIERTPSLRAVLSTKIESSLNAIREARAKRAELLEQFGRDAGFADS